MLSKLSSILVCMFALFAATAHAATLNVGPGQTYSTIQSAINAAQNGDMVLVAPGTYYENIDFLGKAITVTSSGGAANTIIDASFNGPAVYLGTNYGLPPYTPGQPSVLDGFTIQHSYQVNLYSFPPLQGAVDIEGNATVQNNTITNNVPYGIFIGTGNSVVRANHVLNTGTQPVGGGAPPTGGVGIFIGPAPDYAGYGITVSGNIVENNGGNGILGMYAIPINSSVIPYPINFSIVGNIVRTNTANAAGVFIYAYGGTYFLNDNIIYGNDGTGLTAAFETTVGQSATSLGTLFLVNNTLYDNGISTGLQGTEMALFGDGQNVYNNVFVHSPTSTVPAVFCGSTLYPIVFEFNDTYSPASPPTANCNGLRTGNLSVDPQFVSPSGNNFYLMSSSPVIDVGFNSAPTLPTTDFAGNPRIQDGTNSGTAIVDMGAYEFTPLTGTPVTETLQSSLNPSLFGNSVTFTAQLTSGSGVPAGSVQFFDNNSPLAVQPVSSPGVSTYTTSSLAIGVHTITANYQPTSPFRTTSATLIQFVSAPATATTLSCNPSSIYQYGTATLNASVTSANGTPTGLVDFTDNGTSLGQQALVNGSVGLVYAGQNVGTHAITATYVPSGNFSPSSASCSIVVQLKPSTTTLVSSLNPSNVGQSVTFTATTTYGGSPQNFAGLGSITFSDGNVPLQTIGLTASGATGTGSASFSIATLFAGSHSITATLNPLTGYAPSSASLTQVVNQIPSTTALTANPASAAFGSPITLTATVAPATPPGLGTPGGPVHFLDNATPIGSGAQLNSSGLAQLQVSTLLPGTHVITAQYPGSSTYIGSTSAAVQVNVTGILTSTTLAATPNPSYPNQAVTLSATVSTATAQTFSGTVTFMDGATALGNVAVNSSGLATLSTPALSIGTHALSANYLGNGVLVASQSNVVQQVVLDSSFSMAVTPAKMSVQTQHHTTSSLVVTPLGIFNGIVTLSCGSLPAHATCIISPRSVSLNANSGPQTASVYLDTSDVIGYAAYRPAALGHSSAGQFFAALFLPSIAALGLAGSRMRRSRHLRVMLVAISLAAASLSLGCSSKYPDSVAPGTYNLQVTGTSSTTASQTVPLQLTVTP